MRILKFQLTLRAQWGAGAVPGERWLDWTSLRLYVIGLVLKWREVPFRVVCSSHGAKSPEPRAREARAVNFPARPFQKYGFTFRRK